MATTEEKVIYFFGTKVEEERACLSNFFPCHFKDADGRVFHSSEQAMMLGKALVFGDEMSAELIMHSTGARKAKQLGRQVRGFDEAVWVRHARDIVERAVFNKFAQNERLRAHLLRTGDALLAEASPHDAIWGIGLSADQAAHVPRSQWLGKNWLGHVLVAVRERLRAEPALLAPLRLYEPPAPGAVATAPAHTHLLILDLEATCERDVRNFAHEIIELPAVLLDTRTLAHVAEFRTMVRPTEGAITSFCTELTSITQEQVNGAPELGAALHALEHFLVAQGLADPELVLPVTCGDWDLGRQLPAESKRKGLTVPRVLRRWCNIKRPYAQAMGSKAPGMAGMLQGLGLPLIGRHHLGIDDARNIATIARALGGRLGVQLEPTGSI